MIRILSGDLLIADIIVSLNDAPRMAALVRTHGLIPGGKVTLDEQQMQAFAQAAAACPATISPGGSSANMLTTLSRLLPGEVKATFFGIAGGQHGALIVQSLTEAGIDLLPKPADMGQSAVSFVLLFPDGQCTIATWPGNACALLKPEVITEALAQQGDIFLVQGSLWRKLEAHFADRLVELCARYGKRLWLTLPTQASLSPQERQRFVPLISQADLLLGNEGELLRIYPGDEAAALARLQQALQPQAVGFVTRGALGAAIIARDSIEYIAPVPLRGPIANTLGAGDTAFAGFAAGLLKGLPHKRAAQVAMALAAQKLGELRPRLADPLASLKAAMGEW